MERFNFHNPCSRYITTGNQLCNGYIAINGGGLTGKGLGNSTQKYLYLPEAHTDFVVSVLLIFLVDLFVLVLLFIFLCILWLI